MLPDLSRLEIGNPGAGSSKPRYVTKDKLYPFDTHDSMLEAIKSDKLVRTRIQIHHQWKRRGVYNTGLVNIVLRIGRNGIIMGKKPFEPSRPQHLDDDDFDDQWEPVYTGSNCFFLEYERDNNRLHLHSLFLDIPDRSTCEWITPTFLSKVEIKDAQERPTGQYTWARVDASDAVQRHGDLFLNLVDVVAALLRVDYTYLEDTYTLPDYDVDVPTTGGIPGNRIFLQKGAPVDANPLKATIRGSLVSRCIEGVGYYEKRGYFDNHCQCDRPLVDISQPLGTITNEKNEVMPKDASMSLYPNDWFTKKDKRPFMFVAPYTQTLESVVPSDPIVAQKQRVLTIYQLYLLDFDEGVVYSRCLFSMIPQNMLIMKLTAGTLPYNLMTNLGFIRDPDGFWYTKDMTFKTTVYDPWWNDLHYKWTTNKFRLGNDSVLPASNYANVQWYTIEYKLTTNADITNMTLNTIQHFVNGGVSDVNNVARWSFTPLFMNQQRWEHDPKRLDALRQLPLLYFDPYAMLSAQLQAYDDGQRNLTQTEADEYLKHLKHIYQYRTSQNDPLCVFAWKISKSIPKASTLIVFKRWMIQKFSNLLCAIELLLDWRQWSFNYVYSSNGRLQEISSFPRPEARKYYHRDGNATFTNIVKVETNENGEGDNWIENGPTRVLTRASVETVRVFTPYSITPHATKEKFHLVNSEYNWSGSAKELSRRGTKRLLR